MRKCIHCKEPMFNSFESIWINGKNYDIHKKCKEEFAKSQKGVQEVKKHG